MDVIIFLLVQALNYYLSMPSITYGLVNCFGGIDRLIVLINSII